MDFNTLIVPEQWNVKIRRGHRPSGTSTNKCTKEASAEGDLAGDTEAWSKKFVEAGLWRKLSLRKLWNTRKPWRENKLITVQKFRNNIYVVLVTINRFANAHTTREVLRRAGEYNPSSSSSSPSRFNVKVCLFKHLLWRSLHVRTNFKLTRWQNKRMSQKIVH